MMFHAINENLLERARKGDKCAIEQVIHQLTPALVRMSMGLTGREDVARGVLRFIFLKGATQFAGWSDTSAPARWFYHHTLLTARRAENQAVDPKTDPLGKKLEKDFPYQALLRAVRQLPRQQAEAILLRYGENLDLRPLAITMDCSTTAASVHLDSAMDTLNAMTGGKASSLLATLHDQFQSLTLPSDEIMTLSRHCVHQALRPSWVKTLVKLGILAFLIIVVIWAYQHFFKS
jgi:DNA-directed RNA polymerase specialized sigma24 family protein